MTVGDKGRGHTNHRLFIDSAVFCSVFLCPFAHEDNLQSAAAATKYSVLLLLLLLRCRFRFFRVPVGLAFDCTKK